MSTTKPTETGWSKEFPTADGDYLCRINEHDLSPVSFRLENGAIYEYGRGKNLRSDYHHNARGYEFLGPFSASDFEQLLRLRKQVETLANALKETAFSYHVEAEHKEGFAACRNTYCATACQMFNERLAHTGEQS